MKLAPRHYKVLFFIVALACFVLSQISGYLVHNALEIGESMELTSFLYLTHVRNHGGIFGSFQGHGWIFAAVSIAILAALCVYLFRSKHIRNYEFICFGIIVGAGSSNIADRLIYGSVIDYFNVQGIPYWHYIFNTADVLIHVGVWPMIALSFWEIRRKDTSTNK